MHRVRPLTTSFVMLQLLLVAPRARADGPAAEAPEWKRGDPVPSGYEVRSTPRVWPLITGGLLFVPSYAYAASKGLSGSASDHYSGEEFGTGWLLAIPVVGPLYFDGSRCSDAKEYYGRGAGDEPEDTCSAGWGWEWLAVPQILGLAFVGASFVAPTFSLQRSSSSSSAMGEAWWVGVSRSDRGTPIWTLRLTAN